MSNDLDGLYLEWLYEMVGTHSSPEGHYQLLRRLLASEFMPMPEAPSDENRCGDGLVLREEFRRTDRTIRPPRHWIEMGCSVLEMQIGIARHLDFEMDGGVGTWFWHLNENLGLAKYDDRRYRDKPVDLILERLVWRQYAYNGHGGMFPLREPRQDQRHVELWFQMESYMLEMS